MVRLGNERLITRALAGSVLDDKDKLLPECHAMANKFLRMREHAERQLHVIHTRHVRTQTAHTRVSGLLCWRSAHGVGPPKCADRTSAG